MSQQPTSSKKPTVYIYVKEGAQSTNILARYIAKNLKPINKFVLVKIIKVNAKTKKIVQKKGVTQTPTLIYGNKKIVSLEKIVKILTPPSDRKDNFGNGNTSSDEYLHNMQMTILDEEESEDEMGDDRRQEEIRQRMRAFQSRRPEMKGVNKKSRIRGGHKVHKKEPAKTKFHGDDEFRSLTGVDNIESTPSYGYMSDMDGQLMLEEYRNDLADASGRKVGKQISRRR